MTHIFISDSQCSIIMVKYLLDWCRNAFNSLSYSILPYHHDESQIVAHITGYYHAKNEPIRYKMEILIKEKHWLHANVIRLTHQYRERTLLERNYPRLRFGATTCHQIISQQP